jgi:HSP20 family protein
MATTDKSTQQSAYMPSSGRQQGGTTGERGGESAAQVQGGQGSSQGAGRQNLQRYGRNDGRSLQQARGGLVDPRDYLRSGSSPFSIMRRMTEEIDQLFQTFALGGNTPAAGARDTGALLDASMVSTWVPRVEMFEREGRLVVQVDLPGVPADEINVQLEEDALVVSGQREQQSERNRDGVYISERSYGAFSRVVPLPEGVDVEKATASFRDGVLQIEIPMTQRQRGRTLQISGGESSASSKGEEGAQSRGSGQTGATASGGQQAASAASGQPAATAGQHSASGQTGTSGQQQASAGATQQRGSSSEGSGSK